MIESLVVKAQQGDKMALETLCRQFSGLIKKSAWKQHVRTIHEDALAVAYISFIEAVKTYRQGSKVPFAGYAKSKVNFAIWNLFKQERKKWQKEVQMESECEDAIIQSSQFISKANIEQEVETMMLLKDVIRVIEKLPIKQQQVIYYTAFCEKSLTQTARYLQVTPQAVYGLKNRAIKFIKKYKDLDRL